jgi:crotonobetainyl-CoA:carnitine CoA-transferase CaiB-like acyl-CoA transferase
MTKLSPGPLSGVRVIDLTSVVSGPVCAALLADQGADVVKIEPRDGDIMRRSSADGQVTAMFVACNRGKRSLALDLKRAEAQGVVRCLAAVSNVLVQNFRPGAMDRLGLGFEALHAINPRLIYASISGVGETGPYAAQRV